MSPKMNRNSGEEGISVEELNEIYDPRFSIGATINEGLMAPILATEESKPSSLGIGNQGVLTPRNDLPEPEQNKNPRYSSRGSSDLQGITASLTSKFGGSKGIVRPMGYMLAGAGLVLAAQKVAKIRNEKNLV